MVWDAFLNRLFIQSEYEKIEGLCYRYFQNGSTTMIQKSNQIFFPRILFYLIFYCFLFSECEHCDGFEHGHTCSDSGDCYENQCHCDTMFSGHACQLGRKCFFYFYFLDLQYKNQKNSMNVKFLTAI